MRGTPPGSQLVLESRGPNFEIEVENQLLPYREIGLDINGSLIIAGPDERNYGFWSDSNISFSDISGLEISKDNFESYWEKSNTIARPYYNKRHNK